MRFTDKISFVAFGSTWAIYPMASYWATFAAIILTYGVAETNDLRNFLLTILSLFGIL